MTTGHAPRSIACWARRRRPPRTPACARMRAMRRCLLLLGLAACGDDKPTRGDCARAVAHVVLLEDVESLVDAELKDEVGKDLVTDQHITEKQALGVIKAHDLASIDGDNDGARRLEACTKW